MTLPTAPSREERSGASWRVTAPRTATGRTTRSPWGPSRSCREGWGRMADPKGFQVRPGHEVELSYRLDYKSAEVKRLPDAGMYTHVTTMIPGSLPWPAEQIFTSVKDTVKVTEDDQLIKFVTRVKQATEDDV